MQLMKESFINNEIWILSIMGAFQRANVYKANSPDTEKTYFKNMLKGYLDNMIETKYNKVVSDHKHVTNIKDLIEFTNTSCNILTNGKINFGIAQKLLNLYLKYNWCLDKIPTPPHFPVDSIIQKKLGLSIIPWTKFEGEEGEIKYLSIINIGKTQLVKNNCKNIAELELKLFSRTNSL